MKFAAITTIVSLATLSGVSAGVVQRRQVSETLSLGGSTLTFDPGFPQGNGGGQSVPPPQFGLGSGTFTVPPGVTIPSGLLPPGIIIVTAPGPAPTGVAPVPVVPVPTTRSTRRTRPTSTGRVTFTFPEPTAGDGFIIGGLTPLATPTPTPTPDDSGLLTFSAPFDTYTTL